MNLDAHQRARRVKLDDVAATSTVAKENKSHSRYNAHSLTLNAEPGTSKNYKFPRATESQPFLEELGTGPL